MQRVAIVGGGIVGLATAYKLSGVAPQVSVTLLEKENAVGKHQSSHNSGVLHAGLYYKPGSLKAKLSVAGIRQMTSFCRDNDIPHEICGKMVVATDEAEKQQMEKLYTWGKLNGLRGLQLLGRDEMRRREPHVGGIAGLHVPEEGIVDYSAVCSRLQDAILRRDGQVILDARVQGIERRASGWVMHSTRGEICCDFLINCAGLHSDRVSRMANETLETRIVPFRGEYYRIKSNRSGLVRNLVYPVPDSKFPFLGVHFTRLIGGGVEAGPNAVLALSREGYRKWDINLRDCLNIFFFTGFWKFLLRHRRMCCLEFARSLSKTLFCRALQKLVPEIRESDLETGGSGVRAQAMSADGDLLNDFVLIERAAALHVLNAPSPAATASLAIADEIVHAVARALNLDRKNHHSLYEP